MCVCGREIMMLSKCCSIAKTGALSVSVIGVTLVLIGWAASTGIAQAEVKEVINWVKIGLPELSDDSLKLLDDGQCKEKDHKGCLWFERDTEGYIVFHLPGSKKKGKSCPKAGYVITKIEVTAKRDSNASSDDSKGDFDGPFPLTGWLVENAFPAVNPNTGIIHEVSWNVARSQEWVTNLNDHDSPIDDPVINSFWYRITVTACAENDEGTHTTWVTDPRGDNTGRN